MAAKPPSLAGAAWLADPRLVAVLSALTADGGEARVAGGAVRNALMGEPIADVDIATTEPPERVIALSERAGLSPHPTGIEHGTVTVAVHGDGGARAFEVTTLREDVETFGRHARVAFTPDWGADASRRDFTMNALYCDAAGEVLDPLGGFPDLERRHVRFVGDARRRIEEDYLRILRFFRMHARYGRGDLDAQGLAACEALKDGLARLSAERIRQEMLRLLVAPRAAGSLEAMQRTGILGLLLPGPDVARFSRMAEIDAQEGFDPDAILRLAALAGPRPELRDRLRLSNPEAHRLSEMADAGTVTPSFREPERKAVLYRLGVQTFRDAVRLSWAKATRGSEILWLELLRLPDEWQVPVFPLTGADLLARGMKPGPAIGRTLRALEDWWIATGFPPGKDGLLARLAAMGAPDE